MSRRSQSSSPGDARAFEQAITELGQGRYVLRLYVTGTTPRSVRAIANLKELCEEHLKGRYDLEVIDIYQQPTLAKGDQIVAAPTLIKKLPPPLKKIIGDLSDTERVLVGLDIRETKEPRKTRGARRAQEEPKR